MGVSLVPGKPAVVQVGTKLVRQETLNIGRMEGSRFRNKCLEFSEDDVVKMKVFTPIMNLVIKTTYESDEAFQAALEKRRRGLKLKRSEEKEEEIDFTLHVTQAHINLVSKALGQLSQEEQTKTRSLNMVQRTTCSEVEVGVPEQSKPVQSRDLQLVERTEDAITGLFQQAKSAGEELLQTTENAIAGLVVQEAPCEVVEVGMPDVSLVPGKPVVVKVGTTENAIAGQVVQEAPYEVVPGKPAVVKVGTKLVRQETLNIGRMEGSRFRNKCLEFSEDDVVKMKVFTPIMNLVIKTTYESEEAFQAALEKRRRGLKLKRNEEKEEEIDFTLHVTQAHINLVSKALGQLSQDEPTKTRSLNIGQGTTRSEVQVGTWEGSKPVSRFP